MLFSEKVIALALVLNSFNKIFCIGDLNYVFKVNLLHLLNTQTKVYESLKNYIKMEEIKFNQLKKHLSNYEDLYLSVVRDEEDFVSNPLNKFLLTKKLTSDWREVKNLIQSTKTEDEFFKNLTQSGMENHQLLKWPTDDDLNSAAVEIIRLQEIYELDVKDLKEGRLGHIQTSARLSSNDCFELGRQAYQSGDIENTITWMIMALSRIKDDSLMTENMLDIYEHLGFSYFTKGNLQKALLYTNEYLKLQPRNTKALENRGFYEEGLERLGDKRKRKGDDGLETDAVDPEIVVAEQKSQLPIRGEKIDNYHKLCRGEKVKIRGIKFPLSCSYYNGGNPYLRIRPIKEEEISLNPPIVIFHEILTDVEIRLIKKLARSTIESSTYKKGPSQHGAYEEAWIRSDGNIEINKIFERLKLMTNFEKRNLKGFQVFNYGPGYYDDFGKQSENDKRKESSVLKEGNILANLLLYISDNNHGGATVFPNMGITVNPPKGSGLFWKSINTDERHVFCPVLKGTKSILNVQIEAKV